MIDPHNFAAKQMELATEFAKYTLDHPDVDAKLPDDAFVYFEIDGEPEFNRYSRQLAERRRDEDAASIVCVHVKGLAPPQRSRLIDPIVEPSTSSTP